MIEPIKPEALRLADALVRPDDSMRWADGNYLMPQAAAELRRLHGEVEKLRAVAGKALEALETDWAGPMYSERCGKTILALRAALKETK
jgi:hypothetical protein